MDGLLKGLNSAQRIAVTSPAPVLQVLAPPGSGKTKTLTARVAYHILHDGFNPGSIIVCTFTVKAAREMQERLKLLLGKDVAEKLQLGTFHSVSRRFLNEHGADIGLDPRFGIADASDSGSMIKRIVTHERLNIDPKAARGRISKLKANGLSPEAHHAQSMASNSKASNDTEVHELTKVYALYEHELHRNHLLDFDDLLLRCLDLLRQHPSTVANIKAVLIDEFQDTNHVQFDLMTLFAQSCNRISTVGDPDQSIYGWRSADVTNLKRMKESYPELHSVNLEENYRSSGLILMRAQEVIEQDDSRPDKSLMPTHGPGTNPVFRALKNAWRESEWIAEEIKRVKTLTAGLLTWDDFSVLVRTASLSRLIEQAFNSQQIPYRMVGGTRFFDRAEVKIVLDYLRVVSNPRHTDALIRVLNVPPRGIGNTSLQSLTGEATSRKMPLWELILEIGQHRRDRTSEIRPQTMTGLKSFINIICKAQSRLLHPETADQSLTSLLNTTITGIDLKAHLQKEYKEEADARWANVEELTALAVEAENRELQEELRASNPRRDDDGVADDSLGFQEEPEGAASSSDIPSTKYFLAESLAQFLSTVALSTDTQRTDEDEQQDDGQVVISTMHAAKGLEWPIVFVPAVYAGMIPHSRNEDTDEERRLLYVAMTRAEALLYLSRPEKDSAQKQSTSPSPFLVAASGGDSSELYARRGPKLTMQVIQEIAVILRRPCPPAARVLERKTKLGIKLLEDNRIPEVPADDTEDDKQWYKIKDGSTRKRLPADQHELLRDSKEVPVFKAASVLERRSFSTDTMTIAPALQNESTAGGQIAPQLGRSASDSASSAHTSRRIDRRGRVEVGQRSMTSFFSASTKALQAHDKPSGQTGHPPLQEILNINQATSSSKQQQGELKRPPLQKATISNPASRGRGISALTGQASALGVQPARPGMKRHIQTSGMFSKTRE